MPTYFIFLGQIRQTESSGQNNMHILRRVLHKTHQKGRINCTNSVKYLFSHTFAQILLNLHSLACKNYVFFIFLNNDIQMFFHTFTGHLIASTGNGLLTSFTNCGIFLCTENVNPLITICVPNTFFSISNPLHSVIWHTEIYYYRETYQPFFLSFFLGFLSLKRAFLSQEQINNLFYILN